ncbi:hypothetical protein J6590_089343, partial [Homalodisca vitripennis]
ALCYVTITRANREVNYEGEPVHSVNGYTSVPGTILCHKQHQPHNYSYIHDYTVWVTTQTTVQYTYCEVR